MRAFAYKKSTFQYCTLYKAPFRLSVSFSFIDEKSMRNIFIDVYITLSLLHAKVDNGK